MFDLGEAPARPRWWCATPSTAWNCSENQRLRSRGRRPANGGTKRGVPARRRRRHPRGEVGRRSPADRRVGHRQGAAGGARPPREPPAAPPFVKVNCAAIPTELIESELFGHEKGPSPAPTGCGVEKFELADGGSIFLRRSGDPYEASQAKLLRVLQDGEFHRVGGEQPVRIAVRVIAATHRRLEQMGRRRRGSAWISSTG